MKSNCLILLILMGTLGSCRPAQYPAIVNTPSENYRYHEVVWHELGTANMTRASQFYSDLFGWQITEFRHDDDYRLITYGDEPIGGIVRIANRQKNQWVGVVSVEDATTTVKVAMDEGGSVLVGNTPIPGRGDMGVIKDPQGAVFGIIHSQAGDPTRGQVSEKHFLWMELWSDDPAASTGYYQAMFDYRVIEREDDGRPYWVMNYEDAPAMGIIENPIINMTTQWIPYIRVSDPAAMASRALSLGAEILLTPRSDVRNGTVAVVTDPDGAIFGLQNWVN